MRKIHFLFSVHNHQPVGNFDHIFEKSFTRAYAPFISALENHPSIKTSIHFSGSLLEWIETRDSGFLEKLRRLVERRQLEIIGGGFYEPLFSILPERDLSGQLDLMNRFIKDRFGLCPKGCWLPERVWDPVLPRWMASAGLCYTLLDNTHFCHAGLSPEQVFGYFITERQGELLALFPLDMKLRYMIPFEKPQKIIEYLCYHASDAKDVAITYADDGEKFGMWPGTYAWVYEQGWLETFFDALEKNREMIEMHTFSEYLSEYDPEGRIYLPTVSYEEMMAWALPPEAACRYEEMGADLKKRGVLDKYRPFIRGGYWNNFMVKYPESNQMHKKMLRVSEKIDRAAGEATATDSGWVTAARTALYRGQCNCSYWHGMFGGIYLNHLRHSVYENLIEAEKIVDAAVRDRAAWLDYDVCDFRKTLSDDLIVSGKNFGLYFSPQEGGSLFEFDFKPENFNFSNTLTRQMEGYHRKLKLADLERVVPEEDTVPVSIHHISKVKEAGLGNRIVYDWYPRHSFLDHFLGRETTLNTFSKVRYAETGNFISGGYRLCEIEASDNGAGLFFTLEKEGVVHRDARNAVGQEPLRVRKRFSVDDPLMRLTADYTLDNLGQREMPLWFGVEFNFTFLAGDDPLHYCSFTGTETDPVPMNSKCEKKGISGVCLVNERDGFGMEMGFPPGSDLWIFPIETVSRSEEGLEKTYQGTTFLVHWKIKLAPGRGWGGKLIINPYACGARQ